jgi:hydrogenase expression/formation protein HypC
VKRRIGGDRIAIRATGPWRSDMCHALPVKVVALGGDGMAKVSLGGIIKEVSVALVDGVAVGDYVVLHVGYALAKIDEAEAQRTLELLAQEGSDAFGEFAAAKEARTP